MHYHENSNCINENCTFRHPKKVCNEYNQNECNLGKYCVDNHPKKKCTFWARGQCIREENCNKKHNKQLKNSIPRKEQTKLNVKQHDHTTTEQPKLKVKQHNSTTEQPKSKDKQHDRTTEHESYLEQMVNTVREGFTEFNEVLANTLKGTNQTQQGNTNQAQITPLNQMQQIWAQVHQSQTPPPMLYAQSFPNLSQLT